MTMAIRALGPVHIQMDSGADRKVPKKARALMVYLAMQDGTAVPRAKLADLLWPYQGSDRARHSLRNCLCEARKTVSAGIGTGFFVCRSAVPIDARRFAVLAGSNRPEDLKEALSLYGGEFAEDLDLPSGPWEDWRGQTQEKLRDLAISAAQRLSLMASERGNHDEAIAAARRAVDLDDLNEISQRRLIEAYGKSNRRGEAIRQYNTFEKLMHVELGAGPELETRLLRDAYSKALRATPRPRESEPFDALRRTARTFAAALQGQTKLSRDVVKKSVETMIDAVDAAEALLRERLPPSGVKRVP